jgi:O-antigen/teichoic acid export membrane protein
MCLTLGWMYWGNPTVLECVLPLVSGAIGTRLLLMKLNRDRELDQGVSFKLIDLPIIGVVQRFGGALLLLTIINTGSIYGGRWLLGLVESPAHVGKLALIMTPGLVMDRLASAVSAGLMQSASVAQADGDTMKILRLHIVATKVSFLVGSMMCLIAIPLVQPFLVLWVGDSYASLVPLASIYCFAIAIQSVGLPAHHIMKGAGHLSIVVRNACVGKVVVPLIVASTIFVLSGGALLAVVLGYTVGAIVESIAFMSRGVESQGENGKCKTWSRDCLLRIFINALPLTGLTLVSGMGGLSHFGILSIIGCSVLAILISGVLSWAVLLNRNERAGVTQMFRRVTGRWLKVGQC